MTSLSHAQTELLLQFPPPLNKHQTSLIVILVYFSVFVFFGIKKQVFSKPSSTANLHQTQKLKIDKLCLFCNLLSSTQIINSQVCGSNQNLSTGKSQILTSLSEKMCRGQEAVIWQNIADKDLQKFE